MMDFASYTTFCGLGQEKIQDIVFSVEDAFFRKVFKIEMSCVDAFWWLHYVVVLSINRFKVQSSLEGSYNSLLLLGQLFSQGIIRD